MYIFRTEILSNYKDSNLVLQFFEFGENHPHQLNKCDGSLSIYYACKTIKEIDSYIARYGENPITYQWSYLHAKEKVRNTIKRIKAWEKLNRK